LALSGHGDPIGNVPAFMECPLEADIERTLALSERQKYPSAKFVTKKSHLY